ncbi:MAG: anaerobic glycerol-3-phosphate dehydrogenase subunit B [Syntrophaceae bacterium]|nr:anaerobic glycerol-3-phosphate dehydrogenase subunit B [Syntrophaceae bacterium]
MHFDLIVIGMGLSGLMAAKTATEIGQKTLIIGKGMGSLCLFSNTIDVLGQLPNGIKMKDGLSHWIKDYPGHPYAKVGVEKIENALSSFLSLFPPPYPFQTIDHRNCLLPTGAGTFRPTYLIPITMVGGSLIKEGQTLFVGFKGFKDFYAQYVADQLKCRGVTLPLPNTSYEMTAIALSRLMEIKSFRENIGQEIKKHLRHETQVGFPAFLGLNHPIQVKENLEEMMGAQVFEIPILPPSIPGKRIFNRFKEWLIQKGVTFSLGSSVSKVITKGKRCEGIEVFHPPVTTSFFADRFILATGRFIGGGLRADREKVFEPICHLPVHQPRSREDWFEKNFFAGHSQPIHQAGILTDLSLRPVNERGDQILENVWISGTILANHHCIDEKSREGIEIATGYMAAKQASGIST